MNADVGIRVEGVSFSYVSRKVIEDISFQVSRGSVVALIGPNGSGKTTLLRIMAGLIPAESGTVWFSGDGAFSTEGTSKRRSVGFVPQGQRTAFPFTCLDVVLTGRHAFIPVYRTPSGKDKALALRAMEEAGALFLKDRIYTRISGGERQLVMIARALASDPLYLLLDEPTTFLDIKNQTAILSLIRKLADERGITAVISIHDPTSAAQYADQTLVLAGRENSGSRIIADWSSKDQYDPSLLKEAFGVPIRVITDDGLIAVIPEVYR